MNSASGWPWASASSRTPGDKMEFSRVTGGEVRVYDVASRKAVTTSAMNLGFRCEAIAFRPDTPIRSRRPAATTTKYVSGTSRVRPRRWDEIRSPGSCLWGVAMSGDKYLAWKEKRSDFPDTPNDWGAGPWRILDLKKRKIITDKPPADFKPIKALNRLWPVGHQDHRGRLPVAHCRSGGDRRASRLEQSPLPDQGEPDSPLLHLPSPHRKKRRSRASRSAICGA